MSRTVPRLAYICVSSAMVAFGVGCDAPGTGTEDGLPPKADASGVSTADEPNDGSMSGEWTEEELASIFTNVEIEKAIEAFERKFLDLSVIKRTNVPEEKIRALKATVCDISIAMMRSDFSAYGDVMVSSGLFLTDEDRRKFVNWAGEEGVTVDPEEATDQDVFDAFCRSVGLRPEWEGIAFDKVRIVIQRHRELPEDAVGSKLADKYGNMRRWRLAFRGSRSTPEVAAIVHGHIITADVTLPVQRSEVWRHDMTAFCLRYWLDKANGTWKLCDVVAVKKDNTYYDPTFMQF